MSYKVKQSIWILKIHIPGLLSDQDVYNSQVNIKTMQLHLTYISLYSDKLFNVKDVNNKCLHEKYKIRTKIYQDKKTAVIAQLLRT